MEFDDFVRKVGMQGLYDQYHIIQPASTFVQNILVTLSRPVFVPFSMLPTKNLINNDAHFWNFGREKCHHV